VAIESTFYDTSAGVPASLVTEIKWAKAHPFIGAAQYGIRDPEDFKVTAHPSTPYAVNVADGGAWGHGIFDESDQVETVTCSPPAAGTTRWDLICLRRDWTPSAGGPTTVTKVEGGAVKQIPAGRNNTPGTLDDQPLALLQWTAGQTQPTANVDLRCWAGNGGLTAMDDLALTYLDIPGATVLINGSLWHHTVSTSGTASWSKQTAFGKIPLFGQGNPLSGTIGAGQEFLLQAGTTVNYYDNSGYARVTFPSPFPNGLLSILAMDGDDWATNSSHTVAGAGQAWGAEGFGIRQSWVYAGRAAPGGFTAGASALSSRAGMAGRIHRINWIAIGF
jgi:hypothetical protein